MRGADNPPLIFGLVFPLPSLCLRVSVVSVTYSATGKARSQSEASHFSRVIVT